MNDINDFESQPDTGQNPPDLQIQASLRTNSRSIGKGRARGSPGSSR